MAFIFNFKLTLTFFDLIVEMMRHGKSLLKKYLDSSALFIAINNKTEPGFHFSYPSHQLSNQSQFQLSNT